MNNYNKYNIKLNNIVSTNSNNKNRSTTSRHKQESSSNHSNSMMSQVQTLTTINIPKASYTPQVPSPNMVLGQIHIPPLTYHGSSYTAGRDTQESSSNNSNSMMSQVQTLDTINIPKALHTPRVPSPPHGIRTNTHTTSDVSRF